MTNVHVLQARAQYLIATWRLGLVSLSFLALFVNPTAPAERDRFVLVLGLLGAYVCYAPIMMALLGRRQTPPRHPLARHAVDLVARAAVLMGERGLEQPTVPVLRVHPLGKRRRLAAARRSVERGRRL